MCGKGRQLRRFGLKVLGVDILYGREVIDSVRLNVANRFCMESGVKIMVRTTQGTLHVATAPGFVFDGRLGPSFIEWYVPPIGTLEERLCWLVHDCNAYAKDLSFEDTNLLLYAMLRDIAGYNVAKANVLQLAASLSKTWYGAPEIHDWSYLNSDRVKTVWMPEV